MSPSLESIIEARNAPTRKAKSIKGVDLADPTANEMAETFWRAEDRELLIAARREVQEFGAELYDIKQRGKWRRLGRAIRNLFIATAP